MVSTLIFMIKYDEIDSNIHNNIKQNRNFGFFCKFCIAARMVLHLNCQSVVYTLGILPNK